MFNFNYYNPTHIVFGKERLGELDNLLPKEGKILITYGGGSIKRFGLFDKVIKALGNREYVEFGGIEPNPRYETLMKAAEVVKKEEVSFILAVGGGSVIDGTKFITLAASYKGDGNDLLKAGFAGVSLDMVPEVVPFGSILTLAATGSEMNNGAVVSYGKGKFPVFSPLTFPKFSILDPENTFTLPKIQVANGLVDTFIHTTEQYITFPVDARIQDRMSEGILRTLIEIGETTINEPENYDARANQMWSATMALNTLIGMGVPQDWTTHMIGHELTALFGIDHAQSLAIVFPALLDVRREQKKAKILQYAERVWDIKTGSEDERIDLAISKTVAYFESLGIKTRLTDYGIKADQIDSIIDNLKEHGLIALSETRDITLEVSREILTRAL
jgi:NADP-dependent alcohol dehydrogenase